MNFFDPIIKKRPVIILIIYKSILTLLCKTINMNNKKEQIERIKQELALYLQIAERFEFPKEEIEKQINLYLDEISRLSDDKNKEND